MASTSIQIASSIRPPKYEVFLSFRGADTRHGFTDHLYAALKKMGITVFRDDIELQGKKIYSGLKEAIEGSQYAVVVISEKFVESKSCLFELTWIMERRQRQGLIVFPVFYGVDPSDVRNQTGDFGEYYAKVKDLLAFSPAEREKWKALWNKIVDCSVDPLESCRDALKNVGYLSGWHVKDRPESGVVQEICLKIFQGLIPNLPYNAESLVGIQNSVTEILKLLDAETDYANVNNVGVIGILGMGGVGKTTLVEVIYARVSSQFQAQCFIYFCGKNKNNDIVSLQRKLISNILPQEVANALKDDFEVAKAFQSKLCNIKVFIVLDNVDSQEQVKALVGNCTWFGRGSRIILTSRDHHLLKLIKANIYTVKALETNDALELFSLKAFEKAHPKKNFEELSTYFVNYSKSLPLALKVFGSFLYDRPIAKWEQYKDKLEASLDRDISRVLEISLEGLDKLQKELFLDIACFFNGFSKDYVIPILKSFGFHPIDLEVLVEKSLLNISKKGKLLMHDLLAKMGQDLERQEEHPSKRKRLWRYENIIQVLDNDIESDTIEVIVLNSAKEEALYFDAFSHMKNLRMLKICSPSLDLEGAYWLGNHLEFKLTNNLRVLEWFKFPFSSLPSSFQLPNLVTLKLASSPIKRLQFGCKGFRNLLELDMSGSKNLIDIPNFEGVPNLKILNLSWCDKLFQIDPSIKLLKRLQTLQLPFCRGLGRSLTPLGDCLSGLTSLEILNLFDCHLRDEAFPSGLRGLSSLKGLYLHSNMFTRIPNGIWQNFNLESLFLGHDTALYGGEFELDEYTPLYSSELPLTGLKCLKRLDLRGYNLLDGAIPDDINCLSLLCFLYLGENNFTRLPSSLHRLPKLRELYLNGLENLKALPKLPISLELLNLDCCPSLEIPYIPMNTWNSNELSCAIHSPVVLGCIGVDDQPYKILLLHPKCPLWTRRSDESDLKNEALVFCVPVLEAGIPKWFNKRSTNFSGTFRIPIDLDVDDDLDALEISLLIVYQVHDNPTFPIFVCELEAEEYHESVSVVFCVPELPFVGLNRVWVALDLMQQSKIFNKRGNLRASIVTKSLNVEVIECWARQFREHNFLEFRDAFIDIYARFMESIEKLFTNWEDLHVSGPIKEQGNLDAVTTTFTSVSGGSIDVLAQSQVASTSNIVPTTFVDQGVLQPVAGTTQTPLQGQFQSHSPRFPSGQSHSAMFASPGSVPSPISSAPVLYNPVHLSSPHFNPPNLPSLFGPQPALVPGFSSTLQNLPLLPRLQHSHVVHANPVGHIGPIRIPSMMDLQHSTAQPNFSATLPFTGNQPPSRPAPITGSLMASVPQPMSGIPSGSIPARLRNPAGRSGAWSGAPPSVSTSQSLGLSSMGQMAPPHVLHPPNQQIGFASVAPPSDISAASFVSPMIFSSRPSANQLSGAAVNCPLGPSHLVSNPLPQGGHPVSFSASIYQTSVRVSARAPLPNSHEPVPLHGSSIQPPLPLQSEVPNSGSAPNFTPKKPLTVSGPSSGDFTFQSHRPQNPVPQTVPMPSRQPTVKSMPQVQPPVPQVPSFCSAVPQITQHGNQVFQRLQLSNLLGQPQAPVSAAPYAQSPTGPHRIPAFPNASVAPRSKLPEMAPRNFSPAP